MAWTAKLKVAEKQNGKLHVLIEYTDGTTTFVEDAGNFTSPQTLNDVVASRVGQLTALDTFAAGLTVGATISSTPTPPAVQTQAQIDQDKWLADYRRFTNWKTTLVDTGIITVANSTYSAMLLSIQTRLQANPSYVNLL